MSKLPPCVSMRGGVGGGQNTNQRGGGGEKTPRLMFQCEGGLGEVETRTEGWWW